MQRDLKNELVSFVGKEGIIKFNNARVLVLGAGGVGTNLIINLASLGIGHIGLVDDDIIEEKNISIQTLYNEKMVGRYKVDVAKEWVNTYNPHIEIKTYNIRLNNDNYEDILKDYDIIVDAFDTQKSVFLETEIAIQTNKPIIYTGTVDMEGFILTTVPHKTNCFGCFVENNVPNEEREYGVFQATGAIAAGLQTMEVIKLILKKGNLVHTHPIIFNCFDGKFFKPKLYTSQVKKCRFCGKNMVSFKPFSEENI